MAGGTDRKLNDTDNEGGKWIRVCSPWTLNAAVKKKNIARSTRYNDDEGPLYKDENKQHIKVNLNAWNAG